MIFFFYIPNECWVLFLIRQIIQYYIYLTTTVYLMYVRSVRRYIGYNMYFKVQITIIKILILSRWYVLIHVSSVGINKTGQPIQRSI